MKETTFQLKESVGGESVTIPIPESYKDVFLLIQSDNFRKTGKIEPIWMILLKTFRYPTLATVFWMRVASHTQGCFCGIANQIRHHYKIKYGMALNTIHVGYGLNISHEYIVVSEHAFIGNNVNLSHFLSIGTNHNKSAFIGNNVYIGPNCCLIENVHVGSNTVIGAGCIVPKDLEPNSRYVGNPARKIGNNPRNEYILNQWPVANEH